MLQDFSSLKTKVFLEAVLSQVSYISIPNCRRLPNCKGFLFYFLGTGPKDWLPFNATSLFGYSPVTQKQKLEKKKMLVVMFITIVIVIFVVCVFNFWNYEIF